VMVEGRCTHHETASPGRKHRGGCRRTDDRGSKRDRYRRREDYRARGTVP
jgi:hypothetical protein